MQSTAALSTAQADTPIRPYTLTFDAPVDMSI
jgi:hypothetical protein